MNVRLLIISISLFWGSLNTVSAQKTDTLVVVRLQNEVRALKDSVAIYRKAQLQDSQTISLLKEIQETLKKPILLVKRGGLVFLVLAALLFVFFWSVNWFINKVSPNWHTVLIQRWIERSEETNVLKRNKKVLLVSSEKAVNLDFVHSILEDFKVTARITQNTYIAPSEPFDIVFANNEDGLLEQKELEKYLAGSQRTYLLYFGAKWEPKESLKHRVSFVNARSQVYGNLINLLKYHQLTVPKWGT